MKTQDDLYKLHDEVWDEIYDRFNHYRVNISRDVLYRVLPVIFLPAVLFWQYWWVYVLSALIVGALTDVYRILVTQDSLKHADMLLLALSFRRILDDRTK